MRGEPIESVKVGIEAMLSSLRQEPYALESVIISIITFDREVKVLAPLTPLEDFQLPEIVVPESGPLLLVQLWNYCVSRLTRKYDSTLLNAKAIGCRCCSC